MTEPRSAPTRTALQEAARRVLLEGLAMTPHDALHLLERIRQAAQVRHVQLGRGPDGAPFLRLGILHDLDGPSVWRISPADPTHGAALARAADLLDLACVGQDARAGLDPDGALHAVEAGETPQTAVLTMQVQGRRLLNLRALLPPAVVGGSAGLVLVRPGHRLLTPPEGASAHARLVLGETAARAGLPPPDPSPLPDLRRPVLLVMRDRLVLALAWSPGERLLAAARLPAPVAETP